MTAPDTARARHIWATILAAAVAVSVAGNVGHAWLTAPSALRIPAAIAAALPPLALLAVTEGLMRSTATADRRWVWRAGVAGAVLIAALAFTLSFAALHDLAVLLGQPAAVAAGWPLLADALIAVASMMLLAHRPATAPAVTPVATPAPAPAPITEPSPAPAPPATVATALTCGDADAVPVPAGEDPVPVAGVDADAVAVATGLVERGVVRADVDAVARAVAGLMAGDSRRSVAVATGLHRDTVGRIAGEIEGDGAAA